MSGAVSGLVVLGVGGRVLMRRLAYTLEEGPRFTAVGSLEVLALGLIWGGLTAPLLGVIRRQTTMPSGAAGLLHGATVLVFGIAAFLVVSGGGGGIVAPRLFIVLSAISFSLLFLIHGVVVELLAIRWSHQSA